MSQARVCSLTVAGLRRGVSRPGRSRCRAQPSLCSSQVTSGGPCAPWLCSLGQYFRSS